MNDEHPVRFSVDYPDRDLNRADHRLSDLHRDPDRDRARDDRRLQRAAGDERRRAQPTVAIGGTGLLFLPPLLMILFRQKYPRWWFDWNLELLRFTNRVGVYFALMDDRYPSTDEQQSVHLDFAYPDAKRTSTAGCRWSSGSWRSRTTSCCSSSTIGAFFAVIGAWFAILFTGRYPRGHLRLRRRRDPLAQPRGRLRADPCHRQLPAVCAESVT